MVEMPLWFCVEGNSVRDPCKSFEQLLKRFTLNAL